MFADPTTRIGAVVLTNATYGLDPEGACAAADRCGCVPTTSPAPGAGAGAGLTSARPRRRLVLGQRAGFELVATARATVARLPAATSRAWSATATDVYRGVNGYWAGETLRVHRDADGTPRHLEVVTFVLTRTPYDPKAPIPGGCPNRSDRRR